MDVKERIVDALQTCKKPFFLYNDDADGLCSFLILQKFMGEGKGHPVKNLLDENPLLVKKVNDYEPDLLIIVDVPNVHESYFDTIKANIVWIDHHPVQEAPCLYLNPRKEDPEKNIPATLLCYDLVKGPIWLAATGMIGDWHYDETIAKEMRKEYSDLLPDDITKPEEALFGTKIGLLARMFNFFLKGPSAEVRKCVATLMKVKEPYEILDQTTSAGTFLHKYYVRLSKPYEELLQRALENEQEKMVIFCYTAETSVTGELSNEVLYRTKKPVIIAREKSGEYRMSLRSPMHMNIRVALEKALEGLDAHGGGHDQACGAAVKKEDWPAFLQKLTEALDL